MPDTVAIDREINLAAGEIYVEKRQLENTIKQEYQSLILLRDKIITSTEQLEKQYFPLRNKVYQAEQDLKAFQNMGSIWL